MSVERGENREATASLTYKKLVLSAGVWRLFVDHAMPSAEKIASLDAFPTSLCGVF
jgi:hypothetical protein